MAARPPRCQDKRMKKDEKAERLAAALRENLRRRKAQARGLAEDAGGQRNGDGNRDKDPD